MDLDTCLFLSIIKWECSWLVFCFVYLFWRQIDQNIQFKEKRKKKKSPSCKVSEQVLEIDTDVLQLLEFILQSLSLF